jgi:hypothetical protein
MHDQIPGKSCARRLETLHTTSFPHRPTALAAASKVRPTAEGAAGIVELKASGSSALVLLVLPFQFALFVFFFKSVVALAGPWGVSMQAGSCFSSIEPVATSQSVAGKQLLKSLFSSYLPSSPKLFLPLLGSFIDFRSAGSLDKHLPFFALCLAAGANWVPPD